MTLGTQTPPHDAPAGTSPVRVLHVLGDAGRGAGGFGITGVERVVETLLEGLGPQFVQSVVYPEHGPMAPRFRALAAAVLPRAPRRRYDPGYAGALADWMREQRIDVAVSHGLRYDFHTAIAARRAGTAHWVSRAVALADDSYAFPARSLYWLVDAWTLRACDGIVAVSQASMRRMMQAQHLPASRFTVIPNGVQVREPAAEPRAAARAEMGAAPGDFVIGGVGQLIPRKAFEVLVAAVAQLPAPRARLVLLGDGPERPRLVAQAQALGVALQLAGFRPDPAAWMANFSVLVLPSRAEGMPLVVLEAMALGVPCIATPVAGTAEVIEDGVSGILTPVGDAAALAAALQRLRTDLARRDALAAAGRARVAREFSQAAMLQRFRDLLQHAAAGRRRR